MRTVLHRVSRVFGRLLMIGAAALIVTAGSFAVVAMLPHVLPAPRVESRSADVRARRNQPALGRRTASLARGLPDLALQFALIGGIAWAGRRILGLGLKE